LDTNRVVVFPLVASGTGDGGSVGEDVSTIIGHALDGIGPLRWIDGWAYLEERYRNEPRGLPLSVAREIARRNRSAFFVIGRVVSQHDSSGVYLELHDVEGDTSAARSSAFDAGRETWRAGLRAVNGLLPTLIPTGSPTVPAAWFDRNPASMASFLLGEEQFRRAQFETSLAHYQAAVDADSLFTLAAIRGAQAAGWNHHSAEAQSLIAVALAHADQLEPALVAFARGYAAYMSGRADEAVGRLREAVTFDPDLAVAWWQLGDTYVHLLPVGGRPDSLAKAALDQAYRLDPTAVYVLFHLLEIAIREGERERTDRLMREFAAAGPDSTLLRQVEIMRACVFRGVGDPDWERLARDAPLQLLSAGKSLAAGGAQLPCAARAFNAVLAGDTASGAWGVGRRWSALQGMQHLLVVWGREAELIELVDSATANGLPDARVLYLLDAALGADVGERAREVARSDRDRSGADYRGTRSNNRLWALALWEASDGNVAAVDAIADELGARAKESGARRDRLTADAVAAHLALARGDSAEALRRFRALGPNAPPDDLVWHMVEPLAVERLKLAELLLAVKEYREALDVVQTFDAPQPLIHLLCQAKSLELGLEAARQLGDRDLERRLSVRQAMVAAAGTEGRQGQKE
jgi:tetratricopeptide (TPR) repeat protein